MGSNVARIDEFAKTPASSVRGQKIALVIAGVGRSGTSALTRVVNLLGAVLPVDLIEEGPGNERGFWEPRWIVALSDEILQCFGSDWYDSRPLPPDWFAAAREKGYIERAAQVIENEYRGARLIAIKDPRICRLAPIYLEALQMLDFQPRIVIPVREPGEMIASIHRREGTDVRTAELIWVRHMLEIEGATRTVQRVWTTYDALLENWRAVTAGIASSFGLDWPNDIDDAAEKIGHFLSPSLRHFDRKCMPGSCAGPLAAQLWDYLQCDHPNGERQIRSGFDAVRILLNDLDRLNAVHTDTALGHVVSLRRSIANLDDSIRALQASAVVEMERKLGTLTDQADVVHRRTHKAWTRARKILSDGSDLSETIGNDTPTVPEMLETIAEALEKLQWDYEASQHRLDAIQGSRCWALTRPLRDLTLLADNLRKRRKA